MSPVKRILLALAVAALGLGLGLVGHYPDAAEAPVPVIWCISAAIVLGGLAIGLSSSRNRGPYRWAVSAALGCGTVAAAWFAFVPGDRLCTRGRGSGVVLSEFECRMGSGIVTVWLLVLCFVAVREAIAARNSA